MAAALQLFAELEIVVDLAVEHELQRPVFIRHRLMAGAREIDDGQTSMGETDRSLDEESRVVWSAMNHRVPRPDEKVGPDVPLLEIDYGKDSAHRSVHLERRIIDDQETYAGCRTQAASSATTRSPAFPSHIGMVWPF